MATCGRRLLLAGNRLNDHYMLWLLIWGHSWMWLNDDFDITVLPVDSMQLTPASLMRASSKVVCGQPLPSFSWDITGSRMQVVADIKPSVASVVLVPTTDPDLQPIRYPPLPTQFLKVYPQQPAQQAILGAGSNGHCQWLLRVCHRVCWWIYDHASEH